MKLRLRSPSTYKRIDSTVGSDDVPLDDYLSAHPRLLKFEINDLKKRNPPIKKWWTLITGEAVNAYNAPIQNKFSCEEITTTGNPPVGGRSEAEIKAIKVDGEYYLDWMLKSAIEQKKQEQAN